MGLAPLEPPRRGGHEERKTRERRNGALGDLDYGPYAAQPVRSEMGITLTSVWRATVKCVHGVLRVRVGNCPRRPRAETQAAPRCVLGAVSDSGLGC